MNFAVVDIEAKHEVTDWDHPEKAGIGSAVTYHPTDLLKLWRPGEIKDLVRYLNKQQLVVGYNINGYDLPVLEQLTEIEIEAKRYDLCHYVGRALRRRVRLTEVLRATLGLSKTGVGAEAPKLFQTGKFKELFEYNANDVILEYRLFRFAQDMGYLLVEDGGRLIACPCPDPKEVAELVGFKS